MSDITLQRANDGVRILLNRGTVIVNAAEQRQGHLYVTTKDMTVSVVGTVFFVSARENGSRVAVIEGEVQVRKQGDSETQLRPGEQVATSPAMALLPVRDEISWSPRAEQHLAMLDKAQPAANAPAPPIDEPEWQKAAGGKLSFDSATVTRGDGRDPGAFPLTIDNVYRSTRGVFKASLPLRQYIEFAYKLSFTSEQREAWLSQVPQWVETDYFAINARAPSANPTKDQMRLMLQSLLADRFKLALHFEARQTQALALTLLSPGRLGPQMRLHSDGPPCLTKRDDSDLFPVDIDPGVWPYTCETVIFIRPGVPTERLGQEVRKVSIHNQMAAGRNVGMDVILDALMRSGSGLEFPVVDQTGLKGVFDFSMEWTPEPGSPLAKLDTTERTPDFVPTVLSEALRDQLGMKLEATRTAVPTLIIDHVERAE
jgi:uncharacterized protein (TIGR03435 family)